MSNRKPQWKNGNKGSNKDRTEILVYDPQGRQPLSPTQFLSELLTDIVAVFLAALLLAKTLGGVPSFGARVLFVTQLGLFARIVADIPY